jgi:hypothetical protein
MSNDIFADFVKFTLSYSNSAGTPVHPTSFARYAPLFSGYQVSNPYATDPAQADKVLSYFHATPVYHIIYKFYSLLFAVIDPFLVYLLLIAIIFSFVLLLCRKVLKPSGSWIFLGFLIILSYPSLFALQRGNTTSYICFLLIAASLISASCANGSWFLPAVGIALAAAIRPNYALLVGFIPLVVLSAASIRKRLAICFLSLFVVVVFVAVTTQVAAWLIPGYTLETFSKAYLFYVKNYEFGPSGINYCSSPFRLIAYILSEFFGMTSFRLLQAVKTMAMLFGLLVTFFGFWAGCTKLVTPSKSLFLILLGNIIVTPIFADYHLLILFAPFMLSCLEKPVLQFKDFGHPGFSGLELLTTALLLTPKSLPLLPLAGVPSVTIQLLLNPLVILVYLTLFIVFFLKRRCHALRLTSFARVV